MPGMMGGVALPKLAISKPTKPTKQVHYVPVPKSKLAKSLWIEMHVAERTNTISLDTKELEHLFSSRTDDILEGSKVDSTAGGSKREKKISLLDPKRTHNIGIQLASLRPILPTFADIKNAITSLDEHRLKIGTISILKSIVPTQDEVGVVSSYSGDIKQLDDPDRFFLEVYHIPFVAERLEAWHFMIKFNTDISETRPDVETLVLATRELIESKKFTELLALILAVGNFLNANSAKRDCYGFKMSSLLKLRDTKTVDNQSNLLEYIAKMVQTHYSPLLSFTETELPHVSLAKKIGLSTVRDAVVALKKGIKLVESLSERYQSLPQQLSGDMFLQKMEHFIVSSKEQVDQLENRLTKLADTLETLAELYDEDKNTLKQAPEQFFDLIDSFCEQFREAHRKNVERVELEKQRLKKEKDAEERRKGQAKAAGVIKKPGAEKGFLDNLESSLMNGSGFRAPRARAATEGTSLAKP